MLATKNEQINKAVVVLKELSADEKLRRQIELREKAEHDYTSQMKTARNEGRAEGRAEGISLGMQRGRAEGERAILNNLIASGFDVGSLSKALKIPVSELNKIAYKTKSGEIYEIEPEM